MEQKRFNYIYEKLVADGDDILGIIAYSLYKRNKIEFIRNYTKEHGSELPDSAIQAFHTSSTTQSSLEGFRRQAVDLAREFMDAALEEERKDLEQEYLDKWYLSKMAKEIEVLKPNRYVGFLSGIFQGVVSSLIFTGLLGLLAFVVWSSKVGVPKLLGDIFGYEVIEKRPNQSLPINPTNK
jgi:hypothetical protein